MKTKLIGLMPIRNEDWILGLSARVALRWVDELIILDHASTDYSPSIECEVAAEHPGRVTLIGDDDPKWDEMRHRQGMLDRARLHGATHIAIIDADEVLTANLAGSMRKLISSMAPGVICQLPLYNLRRGMGFYHGNGLWGHRIVSVGLADSPSVGWSGDNFHAREPLVKYSPWYPVTEGLGGVMHFWGASERRLRAKHAFYKVTERLRWPEKPIVSIDGMYSMAIKGTPGSPAASWGYRSIPAEWYRGYESIIETSLFLDREPWQEAYLRKAIADNPAGTFDGLDLFGVDKQLSDAR